MNFLEIQKKTPNNIHWCFLCESEPEKLLIVNAPHQYGYHLFCEDCVRSMLNEFELERQGEIDYGK